VNSNESKFNSCLGLGVINCGAGLEEQRANLVNLKLGLDQRVSTTSYSSASLCLATSNTDGICMRLSFDLPVSRDN
jgi:hypothetical protein